MNGSTLATEPRNRSAIVAAVAAGGVMLAGCVVAAAVDPRGGPPLCPFNAVTGLDCPGCGATRALHFALRGDLAKAADYNILFVLLLPVLLVGAFIGLSRLFGGPWKLPNLRLTRVRTWTLVGVLGGYWILRNLPVAPFSWMGT